MKLELINKAQLKIILEKEDITKWDIDFENLCYKNKKTKNLFFYLMKKAYDEFGFDTTNSKLIVEALNGKNKYTLFITKIEDKMEFEILKNLLHTDKQSKIKLNSFIFRFDCFDDLTDCVKLLNNKPSIVKSALYFYKNKYYIKLILNSKISSYVSAKAILLEYATQITNSYIDVILSEHAERLVKSNLISKFSKIF